MPSKFKKLGRYLHSFYVHNYMKIRSSAIAEIACQ